MEKYYLGIDPGASGAVAVVDEKGGYVAHIKLSETPLDVIDWFAPYRDSRAIHYCVLEKVHSMPKQGVASSFKFGVSYGFCLGVVSSLKIRYELVSPQKWMKAMSCMTKGDKNVTKNRAQQMWPEVRITHANADALLIAEYSRRVGRDLLGH